MDVVFVVDPLDTLRPEHDTSVALMDAAVSRGHTVLATTADRLSVVNGQAVAHCLPLTVHPAVLHDGHWVTAGRWYEAGEPVKYRLSDAHAVLMRTDPPVDEDYLRATFMLDFVDTSRTLLLNSPTGLRDANEHLFVCRFRDVTPPSLVTADLGEIVRTVTAWGRAVLKPVQGMAGRGILSLDPRDPNLVSILEMSTKRGREQVIVQRWIDGAEGGDRRVVVVDGRPVGAIRRVARGSDFRCNMAAGAEPVADHVTDRDAEICAVIAPELRTRGLRFVGIDIIGGLLTEVNVTSPTGIREIDALNGTHLADDIVAWIERVHPRAMSQAEAGS